MTTIAVFGASGRTGHHVLEQALAAGHPARVLTRRADAVPANDQTAVIVGDVLDATSVSRTVEGADAVISVFGQVKGSPPNLQTEGTRLIVGAMGEHGVRRIISLSGGGLPAPHDEPKTADRIIRFLLRRLSPHVLDDAVGHLQELRESGLDWTVVRGPRLTDGPATGRYRVGWVGVNASTRINRADLASFILTQLEDTRFIRELPFVSR